MDAGEVKKALFEMSNYHGIFVDEFSYGRLRLDAIIIDVEHRWIRGFEIKISHADFLADTKWVEYSQVVSSLSVVCPEGLIDKSEIEKPFGLLYVSKNQYNHFQYQWVKRPKCFERRNSLSWLYTYVRVIEAELPRKEFEISRLRGELNYQLEKESKRMVKP
ncbi:MAG: hypothetical protein WC341_17235 [Bacteroidales bacterium]|jgi:hypothetical protein